VMSTMLLMGRNPHRSNRSCIHSGDSCTVTF